MVQRTTADIFNKDTSFVNRGKVTASTNLLGSSHYPVDVAGGAVTHTLPDGTSGTQSPVIVEIIDTGATGNVATIQPVTGQALNGTLDGQVFAGDDRSLWLFVNTDAGIWTGERIGLGQAGSGGAAGLFDAGQEIELDGFAFMVDAAGRQSYMRWTGPGTRSIFGSCYYFTSGTNNFPRSVTLTSALTTVWVDSTANFTASGQREGLIWRDSATGRAYRFECVIGVGYNNNLLSIQRLDHDGYLPAGALLADKVERVLYSAAVSGAVPTSPTDLADIGFALQDGDVIHLSLDIGAATGVWTGGDTRGGAGHVSSNNHVLFTQVGTMLRIQGDNANGSRQWLKITGARA